MLTLVAKSLCVLKKTQDGRIALGFCNEQKSRVNRSLSQNTKLFYEEYIVSVPYNKILHMGIKKNECAFFLL